METKKSNLLNPFYRIAGYQALVWGVVGILIATAISYLAHAHCHGLMHFGGAPNQAWWCYVVEHLTIWLVPALLIYVTSLFLSKSHVRPIDVLGTIAFAELPLVLMALVSLTPAMRRLNEMTSLVVSDVQTMVSDSGFMLAMTISGIVSLFVFVWMLYWMFKAVAISCNLKGGRLWAVYLIGVLGGDFLSRYLIGLCY